MTNNYVTPEVLEIGEAEELILGGKPIVDIDESDSSYPDGGLDD